MASKDYVVRRAPVEPAKPAYLLEKEFFDRYLRRQCSHRHLVDSFLRHLQSNKWRSYKFEGNSRYSFRSDSDHIVTLTAATTSDVMRLNPERTTKLYMALKTGAFGYNSYREFLDELRPFIAAVFIAENDPITNRLKVFLKLAEGGLFEFSVEPFVEIAKPLPDYVKADAEPIVEDNDDPLDLEEQLEVEL